MSGFENGNENGIGHRSGIDNKNKNKTGELDDHRGSDVRSGRFSASTVSLYDRAIAWLARQVETELKRFDPDTGRFLDNGGWAVTHQDIVLSIAYLYRTEHPYNRFYRDASALEIAGRAGDALRAFQYPDGKVEFVKTDGSRWGPIYMPWSMYHWVEAYGLLRSELDDNRRAEWEAGLTLAYEGIEDEMRASLQRHKEGGDSPVHNIPAWNAMALHRASQWLNRPEWSETAEQMILLTAKAQHEDGYWPEHGGPTTLYNLVYIHALGLYRLHGGTVPVLPVLERALRFHETFTYPDGSRVETVDGRTKYDPSPSPMGLVGLALVPGGRAYIERIVELGIESGRPWKQPHFAELLHYWNRYPAGSTADGKLAESAEPPISDKASTRTGPSPENNTPLFGREPVQTVHARTLVVKSGGWYVCLSGFTAPAVKSRWGQDRQSFVGVWRHGSGLVIGGGNSKHQPEWSTFEIATAAGERLYIPHRGEADASRREVRLDYGPRSLTIRLAAILEEGVRLVFRADHTPGEQAIVRLPLKLRQGLPLVASFGVNGTVTDQPVSGEAFPGEHFIRHNGWKLKLDGACRLEWPSLPFNPYAQDGAADLGEAVAIVAVRLLPDEPLGVLLTGSEE